MGLATTLGPVVDPSFASYGSARFNLANAGKKRRQWSCRAFLRVPSRARRR